MGAINFKFARRFLTEELAPFYPGEEITALVKIIMVEVTGSSSTDLLAYPEKEVDKASWDKINKICTDLKHYRPIQHIFGKTEFFELQLRVSKDTLIPRQETEELVDLVIRENLIKYPTILDIGTGSGAIAIALCKNIPNSSVYATDISDDALIIARENSHANGCNIEFKKDDILNCSLSDVMKYDIIVSNPPYVTESEKQVMSPNVTDFEPVSALFVPDNDPLIFYESICKESNRLLKGGGRIYVEINEAYGTATAELFSRAGFRDSQVIKDINSKDRIVSAKK